VERPSSAGCQEQGAAGHRLSIFFNPYGEGLTHRWYKDALSSALSHLAHVDKVAIQTNLSARLDFAAELNPAKAAFWATYHPGQVSEERFLAQCMTLYTGSGIPFSVGSVGVRMALFPLLLRCVPSPAGRCLPVGERLQGQDRITTRQRK
jgi:hypothetical protein